MSEFEAAAFATYNKATGRVLDGKEAPALLGTILSYRYLFDEITTEPAPVLRDLFAASASNKVVFPCDVVELRQILATDEISIGREQIGLFGWSIANKYLKQYSVFLLLDGSKFEGLSAKRYGGVMILDTPKLGIQKAVLKVIVNEPTTQGVREMVRKILVESGKGYDFGVSNSVPGISNSMPGITASSQGMVKTAQATPIKLTSEEANLFNKIKDLRDKAGLRGKVEVRVAGGWVRDKLLGQDSKDIDFCLTNMTGVQFCTAVGLPMDAVIKANSEKSKQLEPVKTHIDGQEVDFVNCRTERYVPGSRHPIQAIGTPQEDAERRDFTIGSIFYNIETNQIEDYVGGVDDLLKNKVLRANPRRDEAGNLLPPLECAKLSFGNDPLRVLRALRFISRFPFLKPDSAIVDAMKLPEIQEAYKKAVSMERAGPEIMGMMMGDDPSPAVRLLLETDFYKVAFNVPEMQKTIGIQMDQQTPHHKLNLMEHTVDVLKNLNNLMKENGESKDRRALMNLAALFHDFGKMHPEGRQEKTKTGQPGPDGKPGKPEVVMYNDKPHMMYVGHEDVSERLSEEVLKAIGVGEDKRKFVNKVISLHMRPHTDSWTPKAMGKFLRETTIPGQENIKDVWKYVMYHSIADSMAKGDDSWHDDVAKKRQHMQGFEDFITKRDAAPIRMSESLLNGNQIADLIPELKNRPWTGFITAVKDMLMEAQDGGEVKTPEQAVEKVNQWKAQNLERYLAMAAPGRRSGRPQPKPPAASVQPQPPQSQPQAAMPPVQPQPQPEQRQAMNWYKRTKLAKKPNKDNDIYEGTALEGRDDEIVKMEYERHNPKKEGPFVERMPNGETHKNEVVQITFRVGDKVRDRRRRAVEPQRFGRVMEIKPDEQGFSCYHIRWDDKDEIEKVRLNDTVTLAAMLTRV